VLVVVHCQVAVVKSQPLETDRVPRGFLLLPNVLGAPAASRLCIDTRLENFKFKGADFEFELASSMRKLRA